MAIIWNTKPQPPSEEEQKAIVEETMDEALEELSEELDDAASFVSEKESPCQEKGKGFGK